MSNERKRHFRKKAPQLFEASELVGNEGEKRGPIVYKALRLIKPETANALGIPAEGPVFVSPGIKEAHVCVDCGRTATPLVYQTGYITESQHFHQGKAGGGIYGFPNFATALEYDMGLKNAKFFAVGQAIGKHVIEPIDSLDNVVRSEKMEVFRMRLFGRLFEVSEGYIEEVIYGEHSYLHIYNPDTAINVPREIRYAFRVNEDGEVTFRRVTSEEIELERERVTVTK